MAAKFTLLESKMLEALEAINHILDDFPDGETKEGIVLIIDAIFKEVDK